MIRILVFSDTHGRPLYAKRAAENIGSFDATVHLGDTVRDGLFLKETFPDASHYIVRGNNDVFSNQPAELVIELEHIKIFAAHGHLYDVKTGLDSIRAAALKNGCSAVLFGHTHSPLCKEEDGVLFLNPGGFNSYPNPHCGVLELDNGKVCGCLYEIRQ